MDVRYGQVFFTARAMYGSSKAKTPAAYLAELPEPRKKDITALHRLIRKAAPKLKPFMLGGMIGYGKYHYKSKSGREGDWAVILLANQKNYVSLYVCAVDDGKYVAETFKKELPKASIGKSCVRIKKLADVDLKVVERMITRAAKLGGMMEM
jgi:uncharacterized protein DUF1801